MKKKQSIEEILDREFRKLPNLEAPATLIPRVLARIDARARAPWWKGSWNGWPIQIRAVSLFLGALLVGGVTYGGSLAFQRAWVFFEGVDLSGWREGFVSFGRVCEVLGRALLMALESIEQPWMLLSLGFVFVMYVTCVALGSAAYQVVSRKR